MAGPSILLVNDDQDACAAMADVISELGYPVDSACYGPTALELPGSTRTALPLLDYDMPGMDGVDLYRRLKQAWEQTVGVLMIGSTESGTSDKAQRVRNQGESR